MQAVAKVKNVRYGVRKLRRVVDLVRGKRVDEAFAMLSIMHTQTKGAKTRNNKRTDKYIVRRRQKRA